ncbi:MAG: PilN domain-containing protein [Phycisphaeraceae bacterium]|nr:PilN domain-containing protein [Phycisphaeraceae bacterium]
MIWKRNNHAAVIGCHPQAQGATLAAVRLDDGRIETVTSASDRHSSATAWAKLDSDLRHWPLAVVLPPPAGLHRSIELPPAADEATARRMIELRLATMFPMQDAQMQWGFSRDQAGGKCWVYLVSAAAASPEGMPAAPSAVVSMEMAAAARVLDHDPQATLAILTSTKAHASITVLSRGALHSVEQADLDGGDAQRLATIEETIAVATAGLPNDRKPTRLLALGPAADLAERIGLQRISLRQAAGEDEEAALLAGGAARAVLQRRVPCVRFDRDAALRVIDRKKLRRRIVMAAAWLIAAVLLLYVADMRGAAKIKGLQLDSIMSASEQVALDRDLALAGYLETLGPTPLAVLDEIGQLTESIQLDDVRYEAGGEFRLRGTQNSTETISKLVNALDKARTLDSVRLVSQRRVDRDKIEFEIAAQLSPLFSNAFVTPTPKAPSTSAAEADSSAAPTEPAPAPAETDSSAIPAQTEPPPPPAQDQAPQPEPQPQEAEHE